MIFDKNQSAFPSSFQREVWWWAVGIVPPSDSLTAEVKDKCSPDVLEGCYQWYEYFNELCGDMYNNVGEYIPASARQYRDILEAISAGGYAIEDNIIWNVSEWEAYSEKLNKSKAYSQAGVTVETCVKALRRTGMKCKYANNAVIFGNARYPKIFHAMRAMENSPNIRKTPARHHFAHCEFRQLFKSYSANYDELLRRTSDDSLYIARSIHDFSKSIKIQRYIHFGIVKYKYKDLRVLDFNLYGDEYPTLRVNIGTCASANTDIKSDGFYGILLNQDRGIQDVFIKNLVKCNDASHKHQAIVINGHEDIICPRSRITINPLREDLDALLCFIAARKASIDQHSR